MNARRTNLQLAGCFLLLVLTLPCGASDGDAFHGTALKPGERAGERVLSLAEIDACLDLEYEIRDLDRVIDGTDIEADLAQSRYRGLAQVIDARRRILDASNQTEIDHFNGLVKEQGEAVDAYNALVTKLNDRIDAKTSATQKFNVQCAEIPYYEADLVKVHSIRERRLAASMKKD
jgi:wobble nucleotide-excising tRNase